LNIWLMMKLLLIINNHHDLAYWNLRATSSYKYQIKSFLAQEQILTSSNLNVFRL